MKKLIQKPSLLPVCVSNLECFICNNYFYLSLAKSKDIKFSCKDSSDFINIKSLITLKHIQSFEYVVTLVVRQLNLLRKNIDEYMSVSLKLAGLLD